MRGLLGALSALFGMICRGLARRLGLRVADDCWFLTWVSFRVRPRRLSGLGMFGFRRTGTFFLAWCLSTPWKCSKAIASKQLE